MSDDEKPRWNPKHRKRKKSTTDEFLDKTSAEQDFTTSIKDRGLLCRQCRKWRLWKELKCDYEYKSGVISRLWVCLCGSVLQTDLMNKGEVTTEERYYL